MPRYDDDGNDVECPECGEDAWEILLRTDGRWYATTRITCPACKYDDEHTYENPALDDREDW